jgi:hypothetical protein
MITCPSCKGNGTFGSFIKTDTDHFTAYITCHRCRGSGEIDAVKEEWAKIGGTHRTWRIAQHEGLAACAERLGIEDVRDLDEMERGERDPTPILHDIPEILRTYENLPQPKAA